MEQNKIIIPDGYKSVITPEGEYGKLKFAGSLLDIMATSREVGPSDEASALRGYPLALELKSNLLNVNYKDLKMNILVHVPGDKYMHSKPVKDALKREFGIPRPDIRRADETTSNELKCVYGTVNPFSEYLAPLPQLVSRDLFDLDPEKIGTNAGALNRFVRFNPTLFKNIPLILGDYSKPDR
jgi:hypothetical protein